MTMPEKKGLSDPFPTAARRADLRTRQQPAVDHRRHQPRRSRCRRSAVVVSNRAEQPDSSARAGPASRPLHLNPREHASRDAYDRALAALLRQRSVSLVCLAGFMRLVGAPLLDAFPQRILNIHPSLLPAFPGLDAQRQALEHGVQVTGATVHLVDRGARWRPDRPAVRGAGAADDDTVETLSARDSRRRAPPLSGRHPRRAERGVDDRRPAVRARERRQR